MYRKTFYAPWPVVLAFMAVWLLVAFLLAGPPLRRTGNEGGTFEDVLDEFNQIVASFQSIE